MEAAARGKEALLASKHEQAIDAYTAALKVSPTSPDYLINRSTAYHRARDYRKALIDANSAVLNAQKRAKRELIIEAQFRRGCAYYQLERYGDAEFVFGVVKRMDAKHKMNPAWEKKVQMSLSNLSPGDERRTCTVRETPDEGDEDKVAGGATMEDGKTHANGAAATGTNGQTSTSASHPAASQTPADKIRHEWYQSTENVYFTLLAKGVPRDKAQIDIQERSLSISFPLASGASYDLTLEPLFGAVKPDKCIPRVLPTKIEVVLAKASPGQKWAALESSEPISGTAAGDTTTTANDDGGIKRAVFTADKPIGPAYPTSSKSGPKDWDKITRDLRTADKTIEDGAKASLDDEDDYEGGDEANHFFKKLFKGASPETQRAMMKSYTESNGTALSTNWEEVSKGPVETLPPDGMEAKKW